MSDAKRVVEGWWPENSLQRAFVDGGRWWQFHSSCCCAGWGWAMTDPQRIGGPGRERTREEWEELIGYLTTQPEFNEDFALLLAAAFDGERRGEQISEDRRLHLEHYFAAVTEIATRRCAGGKGADCREDLRLAMGGTIPLDEQRRSYCSVCVAREALAPSSTETK